MASRTDAGVEKENFDYEMLHEVLMALWGCSTNALQLLNTDVIELEKYLHPGERNLLKKILDVVEECNTIRNFIQNCTRDTTLKINDESRILCEGLYLQAFGEGMDQALQPFREEIVDLERVVLNDSYTPLSLILCRIEKYRYLFSVLNSIIREVSTQKVYGCKLLQYLHQNIHIGISEVKSALEKVVHSVHVVFYKQLTSWLLYGHLEDIYNEFFIEKVSNCQDSITLIDNENIGETTTKFNTVTWDYNIQIHMLPSYIRPSLASKILTIGQTIIMFGNDPRRKKDFTITNQIESSIWGEKEYEYFFKIQSLQSKSIFDIVEFERTIDELKQYITELLWRVAVEEAQLVQQLKLVKDFFLMGRGDLFLEFIRLTAHILNKTPTSHTSRDINLAFQIALRKMHLNEESAMDSFNFVVPVPAEEHEQAEGEGIDLTENERKDPIEKRGWGVIQLKYKVTWPLHLLFSPSALNDYNALFQFLLRVKKTQIDLWNLWRDHMDCKNIDIGVVQLRNNLVFIIDNLQYYLQVDVLESQYTIMEGNMRNTRNFEDVQKAHSIFVANVMSQTFLLGNSAERKNPVHKLIKLLLQLCDDFIFQASLWKVGNLLLTEKEELTTLSDALESLMDWLTKTLNRVRAQPSGEHLAQLLLRLDFNRWFSKNM